MKVSIVIPTYNRAELLIEALRSVHEQSYRPVDVIVVDDGSTDDTEAKVDEFQKSTCDEAAFELRFVKQSQLGANVARNHGAELAEGDYVLFFDSDDILTPDGLANLVHEAVENKLPDCVIGRVELTNNKLTPTGQFVGVKPQDLRTELLEYQWHTMGAIHRKALTKEAGGWDETIRGSDDWVFQVRIKLVANSWVFCETTVGYWRQHAGERLGATSFNSKYTRNVTEACVSIYNSAIKAGALSVRIRRKLALRCLRHAWELGRFAARPERQDAFKRVFIIASGDFILSKLTWLFYCMPSCIDSLMHRILTARKVSFKQ
jgi:glycosyltransferase involved in cell wall biosynthesis